jgi:hypothetical protein
VGILRPLLAHHANYFDPTQDQAGATERLEPEHRPDPPFNRPMILLDRLFK